MPRPAPALLLLLLAACPPAQGPAPVTAPVGVSTGPAISATLGPAGGTLGSPDGGLTVTVPAGALATDTTLTLEPITSTVPGALGGAFRLGPPGQTFATPVTLTFPAGPDRAPGALAVAYQDARGFWRHLPTTVAGGAATAATPHFTDFAFYEQLSLDPHTPSVNTGETVALVARWCRDVPPTGGDELYPLVAPCDASIIDGFLSSWEVSGIFDGNDRVGHVTQGANPATYTAPAALPTPATVPVSVTFTWPDKSEKALLVSQVGILGADFAQYEGALTFSGTSAPSSSPSTTYHGQAHVKLKRIGASGGTTHYALDLPSLTVSFDQVDTTDAVRVCHLVQPATTLVSLGLPESLGLEINPGAKLYALSQGLLYAQGQQRCTPRDGSPPSTSTAYGTAVVGTASSALPQGLVPLQDQAHLAGEADQLGADGASYRTTWDLTGS